MDGSSALYDGLDTLLEKSGELVDGIDRLAAGAEALRGGPRGVRFLVGPSQLHLLAIEAGAAQGIHEPEPLFAPTS